MSERKDALIVGCGRIAGGYNRGFEDAAVLTHALAYHRHPAYQLTACVDPDEDARAKFMSAWRVPEGYATLDDALSARPFDTVSICSPTGTHVAALKRLLEAPVKAVFAEKPIDGDAAAARELAKQFDAKGVPVAVNFLRRFDRSMHDLKSDIAAGGYGSLRSAVGWYNRGIVNNGSHLIDLLRFLTAGPLNIDRVSEVGTFEVAGDPNVQALLSVGGSPFHIVGVEAGKAGRFELELAFDAAIIGIEDSGFAIRIRRRGQSADASIHDKSRGECKQTGLGVAFLSALDELSAWRRGSALSSSLASAGEAIEVSSKIRQMAMEQSA